MNLNRHSNASMRVVIVLMAMAGPLLATTASGQELLSQKESQYPSFEHCIQNAKMTTSWIKEMAPSMGIENFETTQQELTNGYVSQSFYTERGQRLMTSIVCNKDGSAKTTSFVFK